ncbi:MAG: DUF4065 domain-containing protein [Gammaproteobacteria bacterium]|nr:DUF4065 domain-containing protein [Gammaproteobacteria bacterium]
MLSAIDIAKYILSKSQPEDGDIISNLKLQKMLYYSQGFHLAIHKKPLFSDEISHWNHGPVVPTVYAIYQKYAASALPIPDDFDVSVGVLF